MLIGKHRHKVRSVVPSRFLHPIVDLLAVDHQILKGDVSDVALTVIPQHERRISIGTVVVQSLDINIADPPSRRRIVLGVIHDA